MRLRICLRQSVILLCAMMVSCDPADIFPPHTLMVDKEQMSTALGVLAEQPYGKVALTLV